MGSISNDFHNAWYKIEEVCHNEDMAVYLNGLRITKDDTLDKAHILDEILPALRFPVKFTVKPEDDNQCSMFSLNREQENKPELRIIMGNNGVVLDFVNDFRIDDDTLQTIKNNAKKIYIGLIHKYFILTKLGEFIPQRQELNVAHPAETSVI